MTEAAHDREEALSVAERLARRFAAPPQVEAVALAGSRTLEFADEDSDVDLYVYVREDIPLDVRTEIAAGSPRAEIGNATWEPGDEWIDGETGVAVDVMYRHVRWIEEQLDRVLALRRPLAAIGGGDAIEILHQIFVAGGERTRHLVPQHQQIGD